MTARRIASPSSLDARLASLTRRLEDGERRINEAQHRGQQVFAWEDFWLRLLHEYEAMYDQVRLESIADNSAVAA